MTFFIVAIAALVPVTMIPGIFFHYDVIPKASFILFAAAGFILKLRSLTPGLRKLRSSRWGSAFLLTVCLQILLLIISSLFSKTPSLSFFGTGWRRLGAVEYAGILIVSLSTAALVAEAPSRLLAILRAVCVSGAIASLYGISQYFGWDPLLPKESYRLAFGNLVIIRPPGTFGNATYFANYLVLIVFSAISLASCESSRWARWAAYSTALLAFVALMFTGTRAGLLGIGAGLTFLVFRTRPRITRKSAMALGAVVLPLFALCVTPAGDRLRDRAVQWTGDPVGGPRLLLWRDSLKMAVSHPIFGSGLETFATEFPLYQSASLARAYPNHYHESPHNISLDALLSLGIPGLILLLASLFLGLNASFRPTRNPTCAIGLSAGLLGVFVTQQFTTFEISTALLYNLMIAAVIALTLPEMNATPVTGMRPNRLPSLAAPLGALFIVIGADLTYIDSCWAAVQRSLSSGNIQQAMRRFEFAKRLMPSEPGMDLWYSRTLLATSTGATSAGTNNASLKSEIWAQALDSGQRAVNTSHDRPNAIYNLAFLYSLDGNILAAEATARQAVASAPNWFKPHWLLAEILFASGRLDEARTEGRLAADLNSGKNPEVSAAMQRILSTN